MDSFKANYNKKGRSPSWIGFLLILRLRLAAVFSLFFVSNCLQEMILKLCRGVRHLFRYVRMGQKFVKSKALSPVHKETNLILLQWPEPDPNKFLSTITNNKNSSNAGIIWAYWDKGIEAAPQFCQEAVHSWKVRNPDWTIIVLDDKNYKEHVSPKDLPSTFSSLKVQHKSDLLSMAVLLRYGGIYLDVNAVVFKGFDGIWNELPKNVLALNAIYKFTGMTEERYMFNCAIMMARSPQNIVLKKWQHRAIKYMEDPCLTKDECLQHPAFERVAPYIMAETTPMVQNLVPYLGILYLLNDLIWHDKSLEQHVLKLPYFQYGSGQSVFPYFIKEIQQNKTIHSNGASHQSGMIETAVPDTNSLSIAHNILTTMGPLYLSDDADLSTKIVKKLTVVKFGAMANLTKLVEPEASTTVSRIFLAATDTQNFPTQQATLSGSINLVRLHDQLCSQHTPQEQKQHERKEVVLDKKTIMN